MKYCDINDNLKKALERDWIITNGIGGFASCSMLGVNTRRYHGLLVAPLLPPAKRTLLVSKIEESIIIDNEEYSFSSDVANDELTEGFKYLVDFRKDFVPIFTYYVENILIKKYIVMDYRQNTTCVTYVVKNSNKKSTLKLTPLINFRDFHGINSDHDYDLEQRKVSGNKIEFIVDNNVDYPFYIRCNEGKYFKNVDTYYNMYYEKESERGFYPYENQLMPGSFEINLEPNEEKIIDVVCSTNKDIDEVVGINLINDQIKRVSEIISDSKLLKKTDSEEESYLKQNLIQAADEVTIYKLNVKSHSVIAGYPWFLDWGRDTMIAYEGLFLITKRYKIAKEIILTFMKDIKEGLVPNGYSEYDNSPLYNSADSSLLLFEQVYKYLKYTDDNKFVQEKVYDKLKDIIEHYSNRIDLNDNNIYLDEDGLLSCGSEKTQITWMDAKIGDFVVTPRCGKVVEINSLFYNGLKIMEELALRYDTIEVSEKYRKLAKKLKKAFKEKFYNKEKKCLYDVLGDDKVRPNQLFALSLSFNVIDPDSDIAKEIIEKVDNELLNDFGLQTLSKYDEQYVDVYIGDPFKRDSSYHQGITWPWLLGLYYNALKNISKNAKTKKDKEFYLNKLNELVDRTVKAFYNELKDNSSVDTISEIYDSVYPFRARGCFAQAWSISEILRIISRS
jgi:predicted glycogen debranching enzyme